MTSVVRLLRRFWAFLSPLPGWKTKLAKFRAGQIVWPVPECPEVGMVGPWPPEWTLYKILTVEGATPKIEFLNAVSDVSGILAEGEDAVRCVRCGINLHASEAGMDTNLDAPTCEWCRPLTQ